MHAKLRNCLFSPQIKYRIAGNFCGQKILLLEYLSKYFADLNFSDT